MFNLILHIVLVGVSVWFGWLSKLVYDQLKGKELAIEIIKEQMKIVDEMTEKSRGFCKNGASESYLDGYVDGFVEYSENILKYLKEIAL